MTFNQAIEKIMHEVESSAKEPFIVFRNPDGGWHCDTTVNQYGEKYDWVGDIQDPYAITLTGAELADGSFAHIHDRILNERLRAEYEITPPVDGDFDEPKALICLIEENISEFSSDVTDYLTTLERPLAALHEMTQMSLVSDDPDLDYNYELVSEFVGTIENEVQYRLNKRKAIEMPLADGYTEISRLSINDSDVVLSENPDAEYRYMVVENRYTPYYINSGDTTIYTGHTNDYLEAISEFTQMVQHNIDYVRSRRDLCQRMDGIPFIEMENSDCLPDSIHNDFTDKLIIVKASTLKPEYRSAKTQLVICTHGGGARPNAKGTSVFGKELYSGESVCYGRHQIAGIADPAKLPEWATKKIALTEASKESGVSTFGEPAKKPTLQEKLSAAKETAKQANEQKGSRNPQNKKQGERE